MAAILPYLLVAGGAAVGHQADRRVQERQKRIIDAMQEFQTKKARGSEESINKFLDTVSPEARAAESLETRGELQSGLEQSVGAAQAFEKPETFAGRVSGDFTARRAANEATVKDRLEKAMRELAIIGTPDEQRLKQQVRFGRTAGDVDAANAAIRNVAPAYEGAISRVRPSYGETFLSQLLMGLGTAGVGGAGGAAAAAAARRRRAQEASQLGDEGYYGTPT